MAEFINKTDLIFTDISSEEFRRYMFFDGSALQLNEPLRLNVSPTGSHRVYCADGMSHYVPPGWVHLCWKAKDGQPNFVR